jgi:hypothetical protein
MEMEICRNGNRDVQMPVATSLSLSFVTNIAGRNDPTALPNGLLRLARVVATSRSLTANLRRRVDGGEEVSTDIQSLNAWCDVRLQNS